MLCLVDVIEHGLEELPAIDQQGELVSIPPWEEVFFFIISHLVLDML